MQPLLPDTDALAPYLRRIDAARVYSNFGPLSVELAERLAEYFGVDAANVALFANGTLALQAAIETVGEQDDEWVMPSWTFVASGQAVLAARRRPHFADVDAASWALPAPAPDAHRHLPLESASHRSHLLVAPFGARPSLTPWAHVSGPTIVDAASCFDACRGIGPEIGASTMVMVSLHATKALPAGEGAVLVGPADWVRRAHVWGNFGFAGTRVASGPGLNAKLSEYHAAIALASLDQWDDRRSRWQQLLHAARGVSERLGLTLQPSMVDGHVSTTWNVVLPDGVGIDRAEATLDAAGVATRRWWPCGVHEMPAFADRPCDDLPVTTWLVRSVLGLPMGLHLGDGEFERIERALSRVLQA